MSRSRVSDFLQLGAIAGVVQQFRPPQLSDFGGGGIDSPLYVNAVTGEAFLLVNGVITPFPWSGLNVMSFGAKGDGVADDYPAILRAIAAAQAKGAGTKLYAPRGTYCHSQPIVISGVPIQLIGDGGAAGAFNTIPASSCTVLKYTGAPTASPQVKFQLVNMSHGMRGFALDANNLADIGLSLDCCMFGIHEDLSIFNAKKWAVKLGTSSGGPTCSWNAMRDIRMTIAGATAVAGLWLTGTPTTNTCHNSFYDLYIDYGGGGASNGIDLGNCDNNRFFGTYMGQSGGGFGVNTIVTELAPFPVGNYFYHLQAGLGGVNVPAPLNPAAPNYLSIWGYDQSNAQPSPSGAGVGAVQWDNGALLITPRYFGVQSNTGTWAARGVTALAANADFTLTTPGSGLFTLRSLTGGGIGIFSVDIGLGLVTSISDPSTVIAVADPGPGGNRFYIAVSGSNVVIKNRYAIAKDVAVSFGTIFGTPN